MAQRPHRPEPKKPADKLLTERVVGLSAARAVLERRARDVLSIAHTREARKELAEILREAAKHRIAYREVPRDELERIADTVHHEGVCMLVKQRRAVSVADLSRALSQGGFVVALDRVDNPHNVGALLRSAAYFGACGMLVTSERERGLSPAVVRVAEGGAEHVPVCFVPELGGALDQLVQAGATVIGADAHEGQAVHKLKWPACSVLVLGNERSGLTGPIKKRCGKFVRIEGTSAVESLNVSVAAGILMASVADAGARTP